MEVFLGAVVATLGVETPQFIIIMILGYLLFTKKKNFKALDWILNGIKAGIVALIFITAIELFKNNIFPSGIKSINIIAATTFIIAMLFYNRKLNLFTLIALGAGIGILMKIII